MQERNGSVRGERWIGAGLLVGALLGGAGAGQAQGTTGQTKPLDPANLDTTCAACTDFFTYANGGWVKRAHIPAAYPFYGSYNELADRTDERLRGIVEQAWHDSNAPAGSTIRKIGTFYGTCMDSTRAESDGIAPLQPMLDRIAAARTSDDIARLVGELRRDGVSTVFGFGGGQDEKNSTAVIAIAAQGGLGLPDRDYYTRTDAQAQQLRAVYLDHIAKTLALAGEPAAAAQADADTITALETRLADASMTRVEQRDPAATYHKMTLAEVQALTPRFDWSRFLREVGAPRVRVIDVREPGFFKALNGLLASVPVRTWQAYLRWRVLAGAAPNLDSAFVNEDFRYTRNLTGATELFPRWRRCLNATDGALGMAVGEAYVKRYFTPRARAHAVAMVAHLEAALRDRIEQLDWMSPATKRQALIKLAAIKKRIGYPDRWPDYTALQVTSGPFITNVLRARAWAMARSVGKIGKPVDDNDWQMTPQTVDAYADGALNAITFPAGILQPPYFDPNADDAVNYGGIGATIGHEMTHLFDDEGRKYDAHGNLRDWWTPADAAKYNVHAQRLVDQFNAYTVVDSTTHVNGRLTLGENIADLGGLTIAYAALEKDLAGKSRPTIDGFTPEQRFFLAWAQAWRQVSRPAYLRLRAATDPHAPWTLRVNGPLSDMPEFAKAFGCKAGDPMVRPDSLRAQVW